MGKLGDVLAHPEEWAALVRLARSLLSLDLLIYSVTASTEASLHRAGPHGCSSKTSTEASGQPAAGLLLRCAQQGVQKVSLLLLLGPLSKDIQSEGCCVVLMVVRSSQYVDRILC